MKEWLLSLKQLSLYAPFVCIIFIIKFLLLGSNQIEINNDANEYISFRNSIVRQNPSNNWVNSNFIAGQMIKIGDPCP